MYITHGIFPPYGSPCITPAPNLQHNHWITMTDSPNSNGPLGKRKRHSDAPEASHLEDDTTAGAQQQLFSQAKPTRRSNGPNYIPTDIASRPLRPSSIISGNRRHKQIKLSPKPSINKLPSHLMDIELDTPTDIVEPPALAVAPVSPPDMRACHICHSAPKRKTELENYLECQSCTERACFICARECIGGCGKHLCSKCCVEVGEDGDTYCLECYARNVNTG